MAESGHYERLLADERGARVAFARTRDEEFVSIALADRLLKRENLIRAWREHRRLTLAELANRPGLSKGYLSDLENGKRNGTLATLQLIAKILRVDLDDLAMRARERTRSDG